jgi:limonene-1,2-epoxide hydrolase
VQRVTQPARAARTAFDCQDFGMNGSTDSPASVAAAYLDAWRSNDIERVRPLVHDEVAFDRALGSTRGAQETIAGLGRMFAMTEQIEVLHR